MMVLLPVPPGVNKLTANRKQNPINRLTGKKQFRGRIRTPEYQAWRVAAGWELNIQRPDKFAGPVSVRLMLPDSCNLDLDAPFKATLDLLVTHQIIRDDSKKYVREISAGWHALDGLMHVEVRAA